MVRFGIEQEALQAGSLGSNFSMASEMDSSLNYRPRTVLICCMRLIGDVILTTPLVEIFKENWPDVEIDFLVNKKTGEFLEKDPRIRQVIYSETFDIEQNKHIGGKSYFTQIFRKYDLAINTNYADRGNISTILAGRRSRVGLWVKSGFFKDFWKRAFLTHPILYASNQHIAYRCKVIAESLGLSAEKLHCRVFWDKGDEKKVAEALAGQIPQGKYFVVHPFARGKYKMWSMQRFAEVSDAIAQRHGLQPVWSSSPVTEEVHLLHEVTATCAHRPVIIPGTFTLNQMACLLSKAIVYVGLDTAISHLAAATKTPMVALYGPTPSVYWAPWDNDVAAEEQRAIFKGDRPYRDIAMIQKGWDCVPCNQKGCPDLDGVSLCLKDITVGEVVDAVEQLLGKVLV